MATKNSDFAASNSLIGQIHRISFSNIHNVLSDKQLYPRRSSLTKSHNQQLLPQKPKQWNTYMSVNVYLHVGSKIQNVIHSFGKLSFTN
jgi:hypothetical protein